MSKGARSSRQERQSNSERTPWTRSYDKASPTDSRERRPLGAGRACCRTTQARESCAERCPLTMSHTAKRSGDSCQARALGPDLSRLQPGSQGKGLRQRRCEAILVRCLRLRAHSWTMTCSDCLCQTIAFPVLLRAFAVSLNMCSTHHTDSMTLFLCLTRELTAPTSMGSECPGEPVSLGLVSRILKPNFASTHVTTSRRRSQAIKLLRYQRLQASQLDLVVHLILQLLLVARHIGLPAFDPRLGIQKRAPPGRNGRAKKVSLPSSCCRIKSLLQSPPCLQWVLPRVGNNVIRLLTRESHKRCMRLLQHKNPGFVLLAPASSQSAGIRAR